MDLKLPPGVGGVLEFLGPRAFPSLLEARGSQSTLLAVRRGDEGSDTVAHLRRKRRSCILALSCTCLPVALRPKSLAEAGATQKAVLMGARQAAEAVADRAARRFAAKPGVV